MRSELLLDIHLSALCHRHQYTSDPDSAINELREAAGRRGDILAATAGHWIGYYDHPSRNALISAMRREFPECERWIDAGHAQRATLAHSAGDYRS